MNPTAANKQAILTATNKLCQEFGLPAAELIDHSGNGCQNVFALTGNLFFYFSGDTWRLEQQEDLTAVRLDEDPDPVAIIKSAVVHALMAKVNSTAVVFPFSPIED